MSTFNLCEINLQNNQNNLKLMQQIPSDNIISSEKSNGFKDNFINQNDNVNPDIINGLDQLYKKLDDFFTNEVWDYKNINNYKISNLLESINNLKKRPVNKTTFNIDMFYHLEISSFKESKKDINKEILKIKKENLTFIKTHAELFKEYHKIYYELFKMHKTKNDEYKIFFCKNNQEKSIHSNQESVSLSLSVSSKNENLNSETTLSHDFFIKTFSSFVQNELRDKLIFKLQDNISKIKLPNFCQIIKPIILFDSENILKSFRIYEILKNNLDEDKLKNIYNKWIYGEKIFYDKINESMSMTEFSNSVKYIEPFTSLSMDINDKMFLCKIIVSNYLSDYFVICMVNSKNKINESTHSVIEDNILFINIVHDKNDIREQDDHLILYLNYYLSQLKKKVLILSSDYYKFYLDKVITYDFKMLYDIDNCVSKIILSNSQKDLIILNQKKIELVVNNINPIYLSNKNLSHEYILFDIIKKILIDNKEEFIKELEKTQKEIIKELKKLVNFFDEIFNFLESKSKKEIFKIMLSGKEIFHSDYEKNFIKNIEKFKSIINLYLILKFIKLIFYQEKFIEHYIMIFEKIIYIYDKIDDSIDKIRKLSNGLESSNIFSVLNSTYLMIKKIGLFKKVL